MEPELVAAWAQTWARIDTLDAECKRMHEAHIESVLDIARAIPAPNTLGMEDFEYACWSRGIDALMTHANALKDLLVSKEGVRDRLIVAAWEAI